MGKPESTSFTEEQHFRLGPEIQQTEKGLLRMIEELNQYPDASRAREALHEALDHIKALKSALHSDFENETKKTMPQPEGDKE